MVSGSVGPDSHTQQLVKGPVIRSLFNHEVEQVIHVWVRSFPEKGFHIHLMLGSNIVFKSEATRWLSKWWTSRRMADKVTKLTISLFLLFQCCEYFGPKHFPSEVFATCKSGSIARFFYYLLASIAHH